MVLSTIVEKLCMRNKEGNKKLSNEDALNLDQRICYDASYNSKSNQLKNSNGSNNYRNREKNCKSDSLDENKHVNKDCQPHYKRKPFELTPTVNENSLSGVNLSKPSVVHWQGRNVHLYTVASGYCEGNKPDLEFVIYIPIDESAEWIQPAQLAKLLSLTDKRKSVVGNDDQNKLSETSLTENSMKRPSDFQKPSNMRDNHGSKDSEKQQILKEIDHGFQKNDYELSPKTEKPKPKGMDNLHASVGERDKSSLRGNQQQRHSRRDSAMKTPPTSYHRKSIKYDDRDDESLNYMFGDNESPEPHATQDSLGDANVKSKKMHRKVTFPQIL